MMLIDNVTITTVNLFANRKRRGIKYPNVDKIKVMVLNNIQKICLFHIE